MSKRIEQTWLGGLRWLMVLWIAGLAVTAWVSLLPGSRIGTMPGSDKVWHGSSYLLLALPICFLFPSKLCAFRAAACLALYGALIEVGQLYVPGRSFEWGDIFANATGAFGGMFLSMLLARWMPRPEPLPAAQEAPALKAARRLTATRRP
ncbi:MAG: VanZ family protein [Bryobacterales bacterium]|nr:VanZ family protein [Bryobacterales bacterium]